MAVDADPARERRDAVIGCVMLAIIAAALIAGGVWLFGGRGETPAEKARALGAARHDLTVVADKAAALGGACDLSVQTIGLAAKGSTYAAYAATSRAHEACESSVQGLLSLSIPDTITGDPRTKGEQAIEKCRSAYQGRVDTLAAMMEVLDGDERPSRVQAIHDAAEQAKVRSTECDAGWVAAKRAIG